MGATLLQLCSKFVRYGRFRDWIQKDLEMDSNASRIFDRSLFKQAKSLRYLHFLSLKEIVYF
jgi:hypothetical protein